MADETRTAHGTAGWLDSMRYELDARARYERELNEAIRDGDLRVAAERDRRYAEVNVEREKALKIKEEADKIALALAREIQTYKDEKANELRSQIEGERGDYMRRIEFEDKHGSLVKAVDDVKGAIAQLRTDIAIGPPGLPGIRSQLDAEQGRLQRGREITASMLTWAGIIIVLLSVIASLLVKFT